MSACDSFQWVEDANQRRIPPKSSERNHTGNHCRKALRRQRTGTMLEAWTQFQKTTQISGTADQGALSPAGSSEQLTQQWSSLLPMAQPLSNNGLATYRLSPFKALGPQGLYLKHTELPVLGGGIQRQCWTEQPWFWRPKASWAPSLPAPDQPLASPSSFTCSLYLLFLLCEVST